MSGCDFRNSLPALRLLFEMNLDTTVDSVKGKTPNGDFKRQRHIEQYYCDIRVGVHQETKSHRKQLGHLERPTEGASPPIGSNVQIHRLINLKCCINVNDWTTTICHRGLLAVELLHHTQLLLSGLLHTWIPFPLAAFQLGVLAYSNLAIFVCFLRLYYTYISIVSCDGWRRKCSFTCNKILPNFCRSQIKATTHSDDGVMVGEGLCGIDRPQVCCCGSSLSCNRVFVCHSSCGPNTPAAQEPTLLLTYAAYWWRGCGCCGLSDILPGNRPETPGWGETWKSCKKW